MRSNSTLKESDIDVDVDHDIDELVRDLDMDQMPLAATATLLYLTDSQLEGMSQYLDELDDPFVWET